LKSNTLARRGPSTRRRAARLAVVSALLAGLVTTAVPGTADASCPTPPEVFPVADLHRGMTATGSTVVQGTTQTPFDVEILGVQPDGIAPGVDFILAQITGPQSFLDETGGIVAGMSGSPVYISGKLVGSTSYGFSAADQTIMGITPAQPMVDLFAYPDDSPSAAARAAADRTAAARTVRLSPALRAVAARATGKAEAASFPGVAQQITTPLAVSGLNVRGLARFQRFITNRLHLPVTVYGTIASSGAAPAADLEGGDSLAAAASYGDIAAGAIGTATVTCGDMVVGFGHPFFFDGNGHLGMNGADVLKVIKDPSSLFGGYKFAVITGLHGTIDQDRLAGIRGVEGLMPSLSRVVSAATNLDIPGRSHQGGSRVVAQSFFPVVAAFTLLAEEDVAFDRVGGGSVHVGWTIRGLDPDGQPFKLRRDNRYYSGDDATFESIFELLSELSSLQDSRFGHATFTSLQTNSQVTQRRLTTTIRRVLVSSSVMPALEPRTRLEVRPGDTIHMRVRLQPFGKTHLANVDMAIQLPQNVAGHGALFFGSGGPGPGSSIGGFGGLVSSIESSPHNYDLSAQLNLSSGSGEAVDRHVVRPQDRVVTGRQTVRVVVVG
jgi:hypothetical protein